MNQRVARIVAAVFIAPLAVLPPILVLVAITGISPADGSLSLIDLFIIMSMTGVLIAYPMTLLFGLPSYFLLLHFHKRQYSSFAVVGTLAAIVFMLVVYGVPLEPMNQIFAVVIASSGAAVAVTFRAIAGAPDPNEVSTQLSAT